VPRASFLIPTRDNEGNDFAQEDFAWLREQLVARYQGYTRDDMVAGEWFEHGRSYADRWYRFVVVTDADGVGALKDLLRAACARFRQKSIYLEVIDAEVLLVDAQPCAKPGPYGRGAEERLE
jgi:hypothetical protein